MKRFWAILVLFVAAYAGLSPGAISGAMSAAATAPGASAADFSSPRATLLTLYAAMRVGDVATAKSCMIFENPQQADAFDVTFTQLVGPLKLMHAMEERFGEAGRKPFANATMEKGITQLIEKVRNAEIEVDGTTAVVSQKKADIDPNAETELTGVILKKQGELWKVDATTMSDLASDMPASQLKMMRAMRDAVVDACDVTMGRLARGEFKTAQQAYDAYQMRMQSGAHSAESPGSASASRPKR